MTGLRALALPVFNDNYVWLLADAQDRGIVVDPGAAAPVQRAIDQGLRLQAILITHHHSDHVDGLADLLARHDVPSYAPPDTRIAHARHSVQDGQRITVPAMALELQVIAVPGHTRTHLAYLAAPFLFCGDTLFSLGCGRLFEGSPAQMLASLDRLAELPDDTRICCAHEYTLANGRFASVAEPDNRERDDWLAQAQARLARGEPSLPSTIGTEKRCNPFLRCDQPGVLASLTARAGHAPADRLEAFAQLRRWKDEFR